MIIAIARGTDPAFRIHMRPIIDSPAIRATLARVGFEAFSSSPKELDDFVKVQLIKWEKMIKDANIQPE